MGNQASTPTTTNVSAPKITHLEEGTNDPNTSFSNDRTGRADTCYHWGYESAMDDEPDKDIVGDAMKAGMCHTTGHNEDYGHGYVAGVCAREDYKPGFCKTPSEDQSQGPVEDKTNSDGIPKDTQSQGAEENKTNSNGGRP